MVKSTPIKACDRKNGTKSAGRNADGTFASGNPGKPVGARHKATQAVSNLLEGQKEALTEKAVSLALEGDTTALRLCLERLAPPKKDTPVSVTLPQVTNATTAAEASQNIIEAVSVGEITPNEGASIMSLLDAHRRVIETADLEQRILRLEKHDEH